MDLKEQFEAAIEKAAGLPNQSNEKLLELYSLFKQATIGDVEGDRPSGFDFRGAAKYDAWEKRRGMSTDEAMQAYIDLVDQLAAG
jgi:diazepam-binding inhibitor (GABA receptor modulating acyl-CoA-binding protein)